MGSQSTPSPLSSTTSSQDSLHKAKKKSIKSSLGRFFSKKEKQKVIREAAAGRETAAATGSLSDSELLPSDSAVASGMGLGQKDFDRRKKKK